MEDKTKTEAKHTSPSWFVQRITRHIVGSDGCLIAIPSLEGKSYDEEGANANLLAAAPYLLSALRLLLQEVKADVQAIACVDLRIIKQAEDAIAKAEGG